MNDLLLYCNLLFFFVTPGLVFLLIVLIRRKSEGVRGVVVALVLCTLLAMAFCIDGYALLPPTEPDTVVSGETDSDTEVSSKVDSDTDVRVETVKTDSGTSTDTLVELTLTEQLMELGLTGAESKGIAEVFENVGIEKISNISKVLGSGIDREQRYVCHFYNFTPSEDCINVCFNIVKRKIQWIRICFAHGKAYPENNKYRELNVLDGIQHVDYVTLYYRKLKSYLEVDESSVGYRAVYDFNTHSIRKYN